MDTIKILNDKISEAQQGLKTLDLYWQGTQPAAFLAPEAKEALGGRMRSLAVNFPRLAVTAKAERLTVTGFRLDGAEAADAELWKIWRRNGMEDGSAQAHVDALVYGRSFVTVWAGKNGQPQIAIESPRNMAVLRDPASREVIYAFKRWVSGNKAHAVLYGPDEIRRLTAGANVADAEVMPSTGWETVETIRNPLGVVPVVPIVNRGRLSEVEGVSEMADIVDLADALNKIMADMMVTSEFYARPKRWATGFELVEDEAGNVINPFSDEAGRLWQSESAETKFGQFEGARMDGYTDSISTVTQQIGALTGLPPHYLGLNGDQPPSADSIRSAEASLVSGAYSLQRTFGMAWAEVAKLAIAVRDGSDPAALDLETVWGNPETRTPAQAADAASKLHGIGVPLRSLLSDPLGYDQQKIRDIMETVNADRVERAGLDLSRILP